MIDVAFSFSKDANGWITPMIELKGNIYLIISLTKKGRVVIKKSETEEGPKPKVYISRLRNDNFEFKLYGDTKGKFIQVVTSVEPKEIRYANLSRQNTYR